MRRYWVDESSITENFVAIDGENFQHIFKVCRRQIGDKFEVINEYGKAHLVEVVEVGKKSASAKVIETRSVPDLPKPLISLAVCIPRFAVFEAVLEKSVELGVYSVQPLFSDFSFIGSKDKISPEKRKRWQKIIKSACQQSGRTQLLELGPEMDLERFIEEINLKARSLCLFFYEGQSPLSLQKFLSSIPKNQFDHIWILIGGEGGFSESEVNLMRQQQREPISLGSQVLRVETACLATISIIKYEFGAMA